MNPLGKFSPVAALEIIEKFGASHLYYVEATQEVLNALFPNVKPAALEMLYGPDETPAKGNALVQEIYERAWANDGTIDVAEQRLAIQEAQRAYVTPKEHFYIFKRAIFDYVAAHPQPAR